MLSHVYYCSSIRCAELYSVIQGVGDAVLLIGHCRACCLVRRQGKRDRYHRHHIHINRSLINLLLCYHINSSIFRGKYNHGKLQHRGSRCRVVAVKINHTAYCPKSSRLSKMLCLGYDKDAPSVRYSWVPWYIIPGTRYDAMICMRVSASLDEREPSETAD